MLWDLIEVDLISSHLTLICLCFRWPIRSPEKFIDGMLLRANFQKTLEQARGCISSKNNINRLCKSLNEIDDEILAILEPENIESDISESMSIMEPVHETLAEITLRDLH